MRTPRAEEMGFISENSKKLIIENFNRGSKESQNELGTTKRRNDEQPEKT
jgi:hypothetical protein